MQVAVLFDEQPDAHRCYAGHTARQSVLGSGVLQASRRNIVVRAGTVLVNHGDPSRRTDRVEQAFFADTWRLGDPARLRIALRGTAIFAWVLSNLDRSTATRLHDRLLTEPSYLGLLAVNLSNPVHLGLYRMLLGLHLRVKGDACNLFWRAFEPDSRDESAYEHLQSLGFATAEWEDIGARDTIFDEFDTLDHFSRLETLRQLLTTALAGGADDADDLLVVLEDLNPRLAATLGTAAGSFLRAVSEEDFAQAGLTARRYCEQLADALYPARSTPVNGRDVGQNMTKNRLWAYVEEALGGPDNADRAQLTTLGGEIDRVWEEATGQLHGSATQARIRRLLADLALLSGGLLALDARRHRQPYRAYSKRTTEMLRDWLGAPAG